MFRPAPSSDVLQYFILNTISAFLCSASHNAMYFTMGFTNWTFHFMHYLFAFIMLSVSFGLGLIPKKTIPWKEVFPIAFTQFLASVATCVIHLGAKDGALYTIRATDFAVTLIVMQIGHKFTDATAQIDLKRRPLIILIAVANLVAWTELSHMDLSFRALISTPLLAVAQALHILLVFQKKQKLDCHTDMLMWYSTGMTAVMLFIPQFIFTTDAFNKEIIGTTMEWEVIDYAIMGTAFTFVVGFTYSKYWLMSNVSPETYIIYRHSKYIIASFGMVFINNANHVSFLGIVGKVVALGSLGYYYFKYGSEIGSKSPGNSNKFGLATAS